MTTRSSARHAPAVRASGAKSQVADRRLAFSFGRGAARRAALPRIHPGGGDALRIQEGVTRGGREHELAHGHDARAHAIAQLTGLGDGVRHARFKSSMKPSNCGAGVMASCRRGRDAWRSISVEHGRVRRPGRRPSNDSNLSVMPDSAECTTTGRRPAAMRSRNTPAILCQLEADETLVPPNLRTTQSSLCSNTGEQPMGGQAVGRRLFVFEDVAQFFFKLTLGQHVLDAAPRRLAALAGRRGFGPPFGAFDQRIEVMRFFGFAKKLIVDIEMFVVAFAHCSRKALEINRIDQPDA
jgi:hypothetical protein